MWSSTLFKLSHVMKMSGMTCENMWTCDMMNMWGEFIQYRFSRIDISPGHACNQKKKKAKKLRRCPIDGAMYLVIIFCLKNEIIPIWIHINAGGVLWRLMRMCVCNVIGALFKCISFFSTCCQGLKVATSSFSFDLTLRSFWLFPFCSLVVHFFFIGMSLEIQVFPFKFEFSRSRQRRV